MSSPLTPPPVPPAPAPKKKIHPLVWILGGVVLLFLLCGLTLAVGGYFLMRSVKHAGFDPKLWEKNPGLAMTRMVTAMNPDYQVVSTDDRRGTITVREKSTGKVVSLRFDPDKKSMVFTDEKGESVQITASGDGAVVQGKDGTLKMGAAGNKTPAWVPVYPGSTPESTFSAQSNEGEQITFGFKTKDAPDKVVAYYQDALKAGGFKVTHTMTSSDGGMLVAENEARKRSLTVTVGTSSEGTQVGILAAEKN